MNNCLTNSIKIIEEMEISKKLLNARLHKYPIYWGQIINQVYRTYLVFECITVQLFNI